MAHYNNKQPQLKLEEFFNGSLRAWGMLQNHRGQVTRRFVVDMQGTWQENTGVLEEHFVFDDGETQQRTWHLKKLTDGHYTGSASDVIGVANGLAQGFALNWQYTLTISIDGEDWSFTLDDWMFMMDNEHLFNRTAIKKFGLTAAELTLWIEKL